VYVDTWVSWYAGLVRKKMQVRYENRLSSSNNNNNNRHLAIELRGVHAAAAQRVVQALGYLDAHSATHSFNSLLHKRYKLYNTT